MTEFGERPAAGEQRVHAAVVLAAGIDAPAQARTFVHERLHGTGVAADVLADLLVVVSELVSNAVQHGAGDPRLELRLAGGRLRVEVGDDAVDTPPVQRPRDRTAFRGRGLLIVGTVADRWGHTRRGEAKWIWAELDATAAPALSAEPVA